VLQVCAHTYDSGIVNVDMMFDKADNISQSMTIAKYYSKAG